MTHPMAVTNCNIDMETLISDQNRSIATLAITTLLKTGNEGSVERLLKQVCLPHFTSPGPSANRTARLESTAQGASTSSVVHMLRSISHN